MLRLIDKTFSLRLWIHLGLVVLSFVGFQAVKAQLDASYAASQHPVDYATGQTTFSGPAIKGFYAHMQEAGTLDIYLRTQIIDFGFILAVMCLGWCLATLVARGARAGSLARKVGNGAACLAVAGAGMDALENAVSFVMLSNPQGFADWLAYPYSGFAVAKFALLTLAMLTLLVSLLLNATGRLIGRPALG